MGTTGNVTANQHKNEPFKTSPESTPDQTDEDSDARAGDRNGVPVADTQAAAGISDAGVELPAVVPPGKPDGEVDTRA